MFVRKVHLKINLFKNNFYAENEMAVLITHTVPFRSPCRFKFFFLHILIKPMNFITFYFF